MASRISWGQTGGWSSTTVRYVILILSVLSFFLCTSAFLKAGRVLAFVSREVESPMSDRDKTLRLVGSECAYARHKVTWGLQMLTLAVVSVIGFLVLPMPADLEEGLNVRRATRRRTAIRVVAAAGIVGLIVLAFLFGIGLAVYWMFNHMGP